MIERKFISQKMKEFQIQEFIADTLRNVGHSSTKMLKTPLGEKIVIYVSRPGLVVGRKGQNIKQLTKTLKKRFELENPQIEISEIKNVNLDANIIAERIANSLEKFGTSRFKGIGHKVMTDVVNAGALGIEILISGKIPGSRAKSWRFYQGYLKKCGDIAVVGVMRSCRAAQLKTGVIGVKVAIMPPDIQLPDSITIIEEKQEIIEEVTAEGDSEKGEVEGNTEDKPEDKTEEKAEDKDDKDKQEKKKSEKKSESKKSSKKEEKKSKKKEE